MKVPVRYTFLLILSMGIIITTIVMTVSAQKVEQQQNLVTQSESATNDIYLPIISEGSPLPLCRFGVNAISSVDTLDIDALRIGWYADYVARVDPSEPNGIAFAQTIRFSQVGANDYQASKTNSEILAIVASNPGDDWLIGNEPDRRDFQDDLEPHVYAKAYYDMYTLIKTADPTARIFAGTIVQPTPVRLTYLDLVLSSYQTTYGTAMPVDGWSIHNFILNEVSCDFDDTNCWGAEIPPGVSANTGEILTIDDNDNIVLFKERVERFRQWMFDNGYGGLPVLLSEYGILMPDYLGFDDARVNTFMNASFDYLLTATDAQLGDPNDGNRLVQKLAWYSTGGPGDVYNGYLFDPTTKALSPMGANYAAYTALISSEYDLYPSLLSTDPVSPTSGSPVTVTVTATIANSGNVTKKTAVSTVRFYDGDPLNGGVQIGTDQTVSLSGCGDNTSVSVEWANVLVGSYELYVTVDATNRVTESDEQNNTTSITFVVNSS